MRKVKEIITLRSGEIMAVCEDGTLWWAQWSGEGDPVWKSIEAPPEGERKKQPETPEETVERLRESGGRGLIIGRGLKNED
jgi:hypothetical protein